MTYINMKGDYAGLAYFSHGTGEVRRGFNRKLEHHISMLMLIGRTVIGEFAETPHKIGIKPVDHVN